MSEARGDRKYQVIASALRSAIQDGVYAPGARLPGENELMQDYGVARMTARQALAVLTNEGLVVPRKGLGVFVREFRPIIREGIGRLSGQTWPAGRSIWSAEVGTRDLQVDEIRVSRQEPPPHARLLLDLSDDDAMVVVRSRRFVLDGKPVLVAVSYLPVEIAGGTAIEQENPGPGGIYARLSDLGFAPVRFREDLRARMPEPEDAARLVMPPGTPVVEIVRTAYTASGQAVEANEMIADADAYVFRYDFGS